MDMMERMMGKIPAARAKGKGEGEGDGEGESGGKGQTGLSDAANEAVGGGGMAKARNAASRRPRAPPAPKCPRNSARRLTPTTAARRKRSSEHGTDETFRTCHCRRFGHRLAGAAPACQDLPNGRKDDAIPAQAELVYEKGMQYLARTPERKGAWNDSVGAEPGVVGPLRGRVSRPWRGSRERPLRQDIRKGIDYILSQQNEKNGYIGSSMYNHASPPRRSPRPTAWWTTRRSRPRSRRRSS
jgi:hypothetical protein